VALVAALVLLLVSRVPGKWARGRLVAFAIASLPFLVVLPLTLDRSGPGWDVGPVRVSERGLLSGLAVTFRCLAIGAVSLVLVGTAPLHHTIAAAHRLRVPGLVLLTLLAYRYAFLLGDELRRLRVALRTRGFRPTADRHGYRTLGHVTGAILVRGSDRAERVADAMRCRGFNGQFHTLTAFQTTPADVLAFLGVVFVTAGLVAWDYLSRASLASGGPVINLSPGFRLL
jgi:cobalt/nickel transport system permease protein